MDIRIQEQQGNHHKRVTNMIEPTLISERRILSCRTRRIYSAIPQVLLIIAVLFILAGALSNHHRYYLALLCLMLSNITFLFVKSLQLHSKEGFVLSILNLLICLALALQFVFVHFPVLASTDWHLGTVIVLFYATDIAIYRHFFKGKMNTDKGTILAAAAFIAGPVLAAILFYCGVPSWIGLFTIVVTDMISEATRHFSKRPSRI